MRAESYRPPSGRGGRGPSWRKIAQCTVSHREPYHALTVVEPGRTMLRVGKNETLVDILPGGTAITEKLAPDAGGYEVDDTLELFFPRDDDPVRVKIHADRVQQRLAGTIYGKRHLEKPARVLCCLQPSCSKGPHQACLSRAGCHGGSGSAELARGPGAGADADAEYASTSIFAMITRSRWPWPS